MATNYTKDIESNKELDHFILEGRRRMSQFQTMYKDAIRYAFGDQIKKKRKRGWEYPVINRLYADIMQEIAMLSANNPRIDTPPAEDTDIAVAKTCGQVLKGVWSEVLKMRIKIMQALLDKHLSGIMIGKWFWEPRASWDETQAQTTGHGWKGRLEVNIINPNYFGCDPDVELAVEIPEKAKFVWTERWVSKQYAAERWPKYKKYLKERGEWEKVRDGTPHVGVGTDNERGFNRSSFSWSGREASIMDEREVQSRLADIIVGETTNNNTGIADEQTATGDMVRIQEVFNRDWTTEQVPAETRDVEMGIGAAAHIFQNQGDPIYYDSEKPVKNENGEIDSYGEFSGPWPQEEIRPAYDRPKYPNGRLRIRIGEECIVHDQPWPYKKWPFAISVHYLLPHMWLGVNAVELSRGFQDWMNIIAAHMTNYVKYFSDPVWMIEQGATVKDKGKTKSIVPNWAGAIVRLAKGGMGRVQRMDPPRLSPELFQIFELFKGSDQDLKGVHDVAQGKASRDNTLGELEMLNRNTRQRVAMQGAFLDEWLKQVSSGVIELMQRHFEVGEWVRWTGDSPEATKSAVQWTQKMAEAKYDVVLEPVSTLPFDEEREVAKYVQAYEMTGPAMLEDVLKKMKIQNIQEILMKHEIIGPLTQLMEMSQQVGMGPDQLLAAIQSQMQLLGSMLGPAPELPGGGGSPNQDQMNMLMQAEGGPPI